MNANREAENWVLLPFPYSDSAAHIGPFDSREQAEGFASENRLAYAAVPLEPARYGTRRRMVAP